MRAALAAARLAPTPWRPWRCRSCGNRHDHLLSICPYTDTPRDQR
jgi:hypothetical protein